GIVLFPEPIFRQITGHHVGMTLSQLLSNLRLRVGPAGLNQLCVYVGYRVDEVFGMVHGMMLIVVPRKLGQSAVCAPFVAPNWLVGGHMPLYNWNQRFPITAQNMEHSQFRFAVRVSPR